MNNMDNEFIILFDSKFIPENFDQYIQINLEEEFNKKTDNYNNCLKLSYIGGFIIDIKEPIELKMGSITIPIKEGILNIPYMPCYHDICINTNDFSKIKLYKNPKLQLELELASILGNKTIILTNMNIDKIKTHLGNCVLYGNGMSVLCERDYTNYKKVDENEYYYNIENNVEILNKYKNEFMLYIKIKKFFLDSIDDLFNFTNYIYSNDKYINLNAIKFVKFNSL